MTEAELMEAVDANYHRYGVPTMVTYQGSSYRIELLPRVVQSGGPETWTSRPYFWLGAPADAA